MESRKAKSEAPRKVGSRPVDADAIRNAEAAEVDVGVTISELTSLYVVTGVTGLGPQAFKEMFVNNISPREILRSPGRFPIKGKRGATLQRLLEKAAEADHKDLRDRAVRQINAASKTGGKILTYSSRDYPGVVFDSNYPVPILYARGNPAVLQHSKTLACVGSRGIRQPYVDLEEQFVRAACNKGFAIVSGFALGADSIGHRTAFSMSGKTVCVMPGGLDRPFPPENKPLWLSLLDYEGAVFVSELPFGTSASALTLRKRNKLIVAFSRGVLICQSSRKGGAMNAFRFAIEQKKRLATFPFDEADDTSGNEEVANHKGSILRNAEDTALWLSELCSSTSTELSGTVSRGTRLF